MSSTYKDAQCDPQPDQGVAIKTPPGKLKMSDAQLQYLDKLLTILVGFTTFGASITFGLIVSQNKEPAEPSNLPKVDTLIAVSWVLFVMGMLLASLATTILYAYQHVTSRNDTEKIYQTLKKFIDHSDWGRSYTVLAVYLVLLLLPLASALLCLAVVVTMYQRVVGIIALVGFGGGFVGILLFSVWYLALNAEEWEQDKVDVTGGEHANKLGKEISNTLEEFMKNSLRAKLESRKELSGSA
jgi:hypothetical protein